LFKCYSIGSEITKFGDENDELVFNVEKFIKMIHPIFEQIFPVKKQIVYQAKKFGIPSQLISNKPNSS
jgi:hypothetical protein